MGSLFSINSPLWNFFNKVIQLFWLSLLWFVCSIPIVTIGVSTTALYSVTLKYVKNEEGYLTQSFFQAFKQNLKQAAILEGCLLLLGLFLGVNLMVYTRSSSVGAISMVFTTLFFSVLITFVFVNIYVYAILAKFHNTTFRTLLNAVIMAVRHWPYSIIMLVASLLILAVGFLLFPPLLFCAPAAIAYINSYLFNRIFETYLVVPSASAIS